MTTQTPTVELQEWRDCFLPGMVLSDRDQRLAATLEGIEIRDMRNGVHIKASSWVGIVRFEAFTLQIQPKIANLDLMRMILVAGGLEHLQRYCSTRDYQIADDISLFDLVALMLADACVIVARDGLLQGYVAEEEDLPVLRGRLRITEQIRRHYGQVDQLACLYDDHHTDIVDNQILHTALVLCRRQVKHPIVRSRIWQLADTFMTACGSLRQDWREIRDGMSYNRLNARYQEAHTLAWIVLEGLGIHDLLATGNIDGFAFLLDMNPLFEAFITALIQSVLRENGFKIRTQAKSSGHIWDVGRDRSYAHIIPDLLIESADGQRLAIDAKYKRYDVHKLTPSDIYQTFLYAYAFQNQRETIPSALLLYPADGKSMQHTRLHIRDGQGGNHARLHALGIDIPRALDGLIRLRKDNDKGDALITVCEVIKKLFE